MLPAFFIKYQEQSNDTDIKTAEEYAHGRSRLLGSFNCIRPGLSKQSEVF